MFEISYFGPAGRLLLHVTDEAGVSKVLGDAVELHHQDHTRSVFTMAVGLLCLITRL